MVLSGPLIPCFNFLTIAAVEVLTTDIAGFHLCTHFCERLQYSKITCSKIGNGTKKNQINKYLIALYFGPISHPKLSASSKVQTLLYKKISPDTIAEVFESV